MRIYFAAGILLIVSLFTVGTLSVFTPYLENLELNNYDFLLAVLRGPLDPPSDLVIIAIDENSLDQLAQLGLDWPWPRGIYGELIKALDKAGARLMVFDIIFDQNSEDRSQDAYLAQAIRESSIPVLLAATVHQVRDSRFSLDTEVNPLDLFLEAGARPGFSKFNPDRDTVIRHGLLALNGEPTLSSRAYSLLRGRPLDPLKLPVVAYQGGDPEILINYVGGARSIRTVSFYQALDYENSLPDGIFEDKIIFVGRSQSVYEISAGQADVFPSPFDLLGGGQLMPGVEIHANLLNSLLRNKYLDQAPAAAMLLISILLAAFVTGCMVAFKGIRTKVAVSASIMLGYLTVTWIAFLRFDYWMWSIQPLAVAAMVVAGNTVYQYRVTERERAHIRRALKGYVSRPVMDRVMQDPRSLELGGVQVQATVLFADIAGFSKIAEQIDSRELTSMMNDYFSKVGDVIMNREGMVDKYIGDAVMAIWGVPLPNANHPVLSCQAALDIARVVADIPRINVRIGINTGTMMAGNLGHHERMQYTVIGDAVNLASRLEGANKTFGTTILISESTEERIRGHFLVRQLDWIRVVGKDRPVRVYELMAGRPGAAPGRPSEMVRSFERILSCYEQRDWEKACMLIDRHLQLFREDTVVEKVFRPRCRLFLEDPPSPEWDGVYALETK
ncbi:MAG: CHASE2 domain-containing protein [Acidobacteriota bacterium]